MYQAGEPDTKGLPFINIETIQFLILNLFYNIRQAEPD